MFDRSCGACENHRPKLLNRSWVLLVEAISSQKRGSRKYARTASMAMVNGVLRRRVDDRRGARVPASTRFTDTSVEAVDVTVVMRPSCGSR